MIGQDRIFNPKDERRDARGHPLTGDVERKKTFFGFDLLPKKTCQIEKLLKRSQWMTVSPIALKSASKERA